MSDLSELYAACETNIRLFQFVRKAYANLIDNAPDALHEQIGDANHYIHQELEATLLAVLSGNDAYDLLALVDEILRRYPDAAQRKAATS